VRPAAEPRPAKLLFLGTLDSLPAVSSPLSLQPGNHALPYSPYQSLLHGLRLVTEPNALIPFSLEPWKYPCCHLSQVSLHLPRYRLLATVHMGPKSTEDSKGTGTSGLIVLSYLDTCLTCFAFNKIVFRLFYFNQLFNLPN